MSSYLEKQMNLLKFDKRLLEINFKNGSLSEDKYKSYLETLEDDAKKSESLFQSDKKNKDQKESVDDPSASMDDSDKEKSETEAGSSTNNDHFGSGY